jgi:glycosyltransferase involved in cell wall biosynthesis
MVLFGDEPLSDPRDEKTPLPCVTAIIATYNRARYLGRAIESVLDQSLRPTQVIVVDDGSTDSTSEVLERFDGKVVAIRKSNGGKASALNLGLTQATGDLIWIFDDDDLALPDCLQTLATALIRHPECGFAFGAYDHLIESKDGTTEVVQPRLLIDRSIDPKLAILERCFIFQPGLLVRKACYDALGPFNEAQVRSQDYEMLLRLSRRYDGIDVGRVVFHQRQHAGARGSAASPVSGAKKDAGWIQYDRMMFSKIYEDYTLPEYLPGRLPPHAPLTPDRKAAALLQRSCVMARKGLWTYAAADLKSFSAHRLAQRERGLTALESATLKRFFGPYSYADHTLTQSEVFFSCLAEDMPRSMRWRVTKALLSPWRAELMYSLRGFHGRYFLGTVRKIVRFLLLLLRAHRRHPSSVSSIMGTDSQ